MLASVPYTGELVAEIKVEWNRHMEQTSRVSVAGGKEVSFREKGRCRNCWGSLVGRTDDSDEFTGIKCRVCGNILEGTKARDEGLRMDTEVLSNALRLTSGARSNAQYDEGAVFVWKVFPELERLSEKELQSRVGRHSPPKRGWLTRHGFPEGAPSYFYLQASELITAVECLPRFVTVGRFPKTDLTEDESLGVYMHEFLLPVSEDPQFSERDMMRRLGSTMASGVLSAFACELAIKAICLTVRGEAKKTHDLSTLYGNLPISSRDRLAADLHDIEAIIDDSRHFFGDWRYFEQHIGESAMRALIDTERARRLGQAARVLLDEGDMVGLGCDVNVSAKQRSRFGEGDRWDRFDVSIRIRAREGPPK